jgi:hypothetical protein
MMGGSSAWCGFKSNHAPTQITCLLIISINKNDDDDYGPSHLSSAKAICSIQSMWPRRNSMKDVGKMFFLELLDNLLMNETRYSWCKPARCFSFSS